MVAASLLTLAGPTCGLVTPGWALGPSREWLGYAKKGDALYDKKAYHAACSVYKQAVSLEPGNWELRYKLGRSLSRIGKTNEALNELFQALVLNEKHPLENVPARTEIAAIFLKMANYDEAGGQLRQILELTPDDSIVRGNYAICLERLGFLELALEEFNHVARANPGSTAAFYNLGNTLFRKQDYKRAKLSFKRAIGLDPKNHLAIVALARTHIELGESKEALFVLKQAIKINPNNHYAYLCLAEVYEKQGQEADAIEAYKKAIQINPQDPASKAALSKLLDNSKRLVQGKTKSPIR